MGVSCTTDGGETRGQSVRRVMSSLYQRAGCTDETDRIFCLYRLVEQLGIDRLGKTERQLESEVYQHVIW